jgi:TonB family protein
MRSALAVLALLCGCVSPGGGVRPELGPVAPLPAHADASRLCSNYRQILSAVPFPGQAVAANVRAGQVILEFGVGPQGRAADVRLVRASHDVFVDTAVQLARRLTCNAPASRLPVRLVVEFNNGGD